MVRKGGEPGGGGEGVLNDGGDRISLSRNRNSKGPGWQVGRLWLFRERGPIWFGRGVRVRGGEDRGRLLSRVAGGPGFRLCCTRKSGSTQGFWLAVPVLSGADTAARDSGTGRDSSWLFSDAQGVSPHPLSLPDPEGSAAPLLSQHCWPLPFVGGCIMKAPRGTAG